MVNFPILGHNIVAPYAGAWIEIMVTGKSVNYISVAPYAGAWIEIRSHTGTNRFAPSRTLRGCVD